MPYHNYLFAVLFTLATSLAQAEPFSYEARVVGVSDGDTITVLDTNKLQHKIRLQGIDAPEKSQPFGKTSRQHLSQLVFSKMVTVEYEKVDRYQRQVAKVLVKGLDANLEQVKAGMAWHYKKYEGEQSAADRQRYSAAERSAQALRKGLWLEDNPVPPWGFRKAKRSGG